MMQGKPEGALPFSFLFSSHSVLSLKNSGFQRGKRIKKLNCRWNYFTNAMCLLKLLFLKVYIFFVFRLPCFIIIDFKLWAKVRKSAFRKYTVWRSPYFALSKIESRLTSCFLESELGLICNCTFRPINQQSLLQSWEPLEATKALCFWFLCALS